MLIISKVYRSCLQNHTGAFASVVIEADLLEVGGGLGCLTWGQFRANHGSRGLLGWPCLIKMRAVGDGWWWHDMRSIWPQVAFWKLEVAFLNSTS